MNAAIWVTAAGSPLWLNSSTYAANAPSASSVTGVPSSIVLDKEPQSPQIVTTLWPLLSNSDTNTQNDLGTSSVVPLTGVPVSDSLQIAFTSLQSTTTSGPSDSSFVSLSQPSNIESVSPELSSTENPSDTKTQSVIQNSAVFTTSSTMESVETGVSSSSSLFPLDESKHTFSTSTYSSYQAPYTAPLSSLPTSELLSSLPPVSLNAEPSSTAETVPIGSSSDAGSTSPTKISASVLSKSMPASLDFSASDFSASGFSASYFSASDLSASDLSASDLSTSDLSTSDLSTHTGISGNPLQSISVASELTSVISQFASSTPSSSILSGVTVASLTSILSNLTPAQYTSRKSGLYESGMSSILNPTMAMSSSGALSCGQAGCALPNNDSLASGISGLGTPTYSLSSTAENSDLVTASRFTLSRDSGVSAEANTAFNMSQSSSGSQAINNTVFAVPKSTLLPSEGLSMKSGPENNQSSLLTLTSASTGSLSAAPTAHSVSSSPSELQSSSQFVLFNSSVISASLGSVSATSLPMVSSSSPVVPSSANFTSPSPTSSQMTAASSSNVMSSTSGPKVPFAVPVPPLYILTCSEACTVTQTVTECCKNTCVEKQTPTVIIPVGPEPTTVTFVPTVRTTVSSQSTVTIIEPCPVNPLITPPPIVLPPAVTVTSYPTTLTVSEECTITKTITSCSQSTCTTKSSVTVYTPTSSTETLTVMPTVCTTVSGTVTVTVVEPCIVPSPSCAACSAPPKTVTVPDITTTTQTVTTCTKDTCVTGTQTVVVPVPPILSIPQKTHTTLVSTVTETITSCSDNRCVAKPTERTVTVTTEVPCTTPVTTSYIQTMNSCSSDICHQVVTTLPWTITPETPQVTSSSTRRICTGEQCTTVTGAPPVSTTLLPSTSALKTSVCTGEHCTTETGAPPVSSTSTSLPSTHTAPSEAPPTTKSSTVVTTKPTEVVQTTAWTTAQTTAQTTAPTTTPELSPTTQRVPNSTSRSSKIETSTGPVITLMSLETQTHPPSTHVVTTMTKVTVTSCADVCVETVQTVPKEITSIETHPVATVTHVTVLPSEEVTFITTTQAYTQTITACVGESCSRTVTTQISPKTVYTSSKSEFVPYMPKSTSPVVTETCTGSNCAPVPINPAETGCVGTECTSVVIQPHPSQCTGVECGPETIESAPRIVPSNAAAKAHSFIALILLSFIL